MQTLAEPDGGVLTGLEARMEELRESVSAAEAALEALQAESALLEERRAAATDLLNAAQREHAAAEAQIATLRQIQAAAEDNAPLREWFERHGLGGLAPLWQKLRIDHGWETAAESILRERLHALELTDAEGLAAVLADGPPSKASVFQRGEAEPAGMAGFDSLASKIHVVDAAVAGALADWLNGVFVCEGVPDAAARAALPVSGVLVNREGHQFTRHTVSFHAPDAADTGLLARQAEIEELERRLAELAARLDSANQQLAELDGALAEGNAALEEARLEIGARQKAQHDAQIEHLKALQAQERYRERSAQIQAELEAVGAEMASGNEALE